MTVHLARPTRALARLLLTTTAIAALVIAGDAGACPLGSHDSPRVRLLHSLTHLLRAAESRGDTPSAREARDLVAKNWLGPDLPPLNRL
jgi:hypothetical protein